MQMHKSPSSIYYIYDHIKVFITSSQEPTHKHKHKT